MKVLIMMALSLIAGLLASAGLILLDGYKAFYGALFIVIAIEIIRRILNSISKEVKK